MTLQVNVLQATHSDMLESMNTERLRAHYLVSNLFATDQIRLHYSHVERFVIGGAMPGREPLALESVGAVGSGAFLARRELGVMNIGGPGRVTVEGAVHSLQPRDALYVGQGRHSVIFESESDSNPAKFYLASAPAHARHEATKISAMDARSVNHGTRDRASERTIHQYIHPDICRSSQLVMGITSLERGSVWNTMPCHLHPRRSEVYFYFDLGPEDRVCHLMGVPNQTRHLIVGNEQAVISPPWSIHMGVGTNRYDFIWAMAGENQEFEDIDMLPTNALL